MDKTALRRAIAAQKAAMTPAQIAACSQALTQMALASPLYRQARSVYGYLSYNQEVRTRPLLEAALAGGKRVAVPKMYGRQMRFLWLADLDAVAPGCMGIPEPLADGPEADDPTALVLVPGLAFDPAGNRLGYGGGNYDRFLAEEPNHPTLALCYAFQYLPHLETQSHDIPVGQVLWAPVPEDKE